MAVFLGTPGCEGGGLGELIRRLRGVPDPANHDAMWCAGIHCLDQWEAADAGGNATAALIPGQVASGWIRFEALDALLLPDERDDGFHIFWG